jgi:hypothetical protein
MADEPRRLEFQMTDLERIAAEIYASISRLQAREANLTAVDRVKLASLVLNLKRVLAAIPSCDKCPEASGEDPTRCACARCELL